MDVSNFFGCYLLYSLNDKFKGRTYIGFTVDPNRRIKQHNKGLKAGGAWKTSNKGPWEMVLIVHGFPNEVSALRFEWAWQHPEKSRRLRHLEKKGRKESHFQYRFRVMSEMLQVGPWTRLPLTVRWLNESYRTDFALTRLPPLHMPICSGPVICHKIDKVGEKGSRNMNTETDTIEKHVCAVCDEEIWQDTKTVSCFHQNCKKEFHIICIAKYFLQCSEKKNQLLPVEGTCINCGQSLLWGEIIRYSIGCYQDSNDLCSQEV